MAKNLSFTGLEVDANRLKAFTHRPQRLDWTRVQFKFDADVWEGCARVVNWLKANCPGDWDYYSFTEPSGTNTVMVVRFKEKNDALMFKLQDGHQSWKE